MMTLIVGGSGSGKSAFAENLLLEQAAGMQKYYLATMQVYGKEGQKKVERHKRLRAGKGFCTIEQPVSIKKAVLQMKAGKRVALLECMSNLTANEMFSEEEQRPWEAVAEQIVKDVTALSKKVCCLVIVSNNVFEDGICYERTTRDYMEALGRINERLAFLSDQVIEVVAGTAVYIKRASCSTADGAASGQKYQD